MLNDQSAVIYLIKLLHFYSHTKPASEYAGTGSKIKLKGSAGFELQW